MIAQIDLFVKYPYLTYLFCAVLSKTSPGRRFPFIFPCLGLDHDELLLTTLLATEHDNDVSMRLRKHEAVERFLSDAIVRYLIE